MSDVIVTRSANQVEILSLPSCQHYGELTQNQCVSWIMLVDTENYDESIPNAVYQKIMLDVKSALNKVSTIGNEFIVNDTLWYWKNPAGAIKPTVSVVRVFGTSSGLN